MKRLIYAPSTIVKLPNIFGDGSDGDVVVSTAITLSRDMHYRNLTITAAGSIDTSGFRILVQNRLQNLGLIFNDGHNATGISFGFGGSGASVPSAGAGGAGRTTVGNGSDPTSVPLCYLPDGLGAGLGGNAGANFGGDPEASFDRQINAKDVTNIVSALFPISQVGTSIEPIQASRGGGGGANASGAGTNSGGGGGGGGYVTISAKTLDNASGTIRSRGGNGAAATGGGNAGGGGGGGGGTVILIGLSVVSGTITLTPGTGGAGVGTGSAGTAGSDGQSIIVPGV